MLVYYLVPGKLRNLILFLGSLIFYAWGEPVYVVLMLFSSVFNYYMGTELERLYDNDRKQKHNLIFAILVNLGILVFFKYYGFLLNTIGGIAGIEIPHPELSLPIGLSFYTFRNLSYLFDIYMSKIYAQRSFLTFAVYSTMFPYTSAGPIVRYADIEEQLNRRSVNITRFGIGAEFFIKGLAKKVLLADNLSALYSGICGNPSMSVLTAWIGIFAYTMQIYFDFSGYSDMAIGLGRMLGFEFKKNFDYPYISTSVSEFWRRWHISLGSWFRDYIYIPLGGNRVSTLRHIRNILIVWALTGLWHGASWNFVLWGVYYGLFLLLVCTGQCTGASSRLASHCLYHAGSYDRMGIFQPDRFRSAWTLPWNFVWNRCQGICRQHSSLLSENRTGALSHQYLCLQARTLPLVQTPDPAQTDDCCSSQSAPAGVVRRIYGL